ncbi:hypothetical protein CRYUN_Cryun05aG0220000 [Craigia yunnanensis]
MAGRKKRKLKLLAETLNGVERTSTEDGKERLEVQTWSDLPVELLELIMSHLTLEDNIRASAVCKRWHKVAISVRVVNQSPWLMYFPKYGNFYEFYDPSERKTYSVELPELHGSVTLKMIVAFSCAPTSTSFLVFTIKHISPTIFAISMCHPGASEWATVNYQNRLPLFSSLWYKLVFCSGIFYCLSRTGWLGVYDPLECTWNALAVPPPRCPENFFAKNWWNGKFMAEHNGDILVIYTCSENPIIFKLDQSEMVWEEMQSLDGVTVFASFLSSHSRTDLPGIMRNSVYFSKVRFFGKRCLSYSLDDCRYYPCKQYYDWGEQDPFGNIWIEPPQDASSFIRRTSVLQVSID